MMNESVFMNELGVVLISMISDWIGTYVENKDISMNGIQGVKDLLISDDSSYPAIVEKETKQSKCVCM